MARDVQEVATDEDEAGPFDGGGGLPFNHSDSDSCSGGSRMGGVNWEKVIAEIHSDSE